MSKINTGMTFGATADNTVPTVGLVASATGYTITAKSKSGTNFIITKDTAAGTLLRTCSAVGQGGCPQSGNW
jgi:hypothetical protein